MRLNLTRSARDLNFPGKLFFRRSVLRIEACSTSYAMGMMNESPHD